MKKKKMTIIDAAKVVLSEANQPLSARDIFTRIINDSLYEFHAQDPYNALRVEIRRHSEGISFPTSSPNKYFFYDASIGKFSLLGHADSLKELDQKVCSFDSLISLHANYIRVFKESLLVQIKSMNPYYFEIFCKKLLDIYGFNNLCVTKKSRDGGIDGNGALKVGLARMNVAFQCKRWDNTVVGRKEIDAFRGAIQGEYEQGVFFTTSTFSKEAMGASIKKGAVPIVLIDGIMIVDIMMEKGLGIEKTSLDIYESALDKILNDD